MTTTDTALDVELDLASEVTCECFETSCHHQHGAAEQQCTAPAVVRLQNAYTCRDGCPHDIILALCKCCLEDLRRFERAGWAHIVRLMRL